MTLVPNVATADKQQTAISNLAVTDLVTSTVILLFYVIADH
jgi:hypothetical protein